MTCTNCSFENEEGAVFCTNCGMPFDQNMSAPEIPTDTSHAVVSDLPAETSAAIVPAETPADPAGEEIPKMIIPLTVTSAEPLPEEAPAASEQPVIAAEPAAPAAAPKVPVFYNDLVKYNNVGVWRWLGVFFLCQIPVLNLIMIIVWACTAKRHSLKNYARAMIIGVLIEMIILTVLFILSVIYMQPLSEAMRAFMLRTGWVY